MSVAAPSTVSGAKAVSRKVWRWIFFGVIVSVLPLVFSFFILQLKSKPASFTELLGNGELLVVLWPLCAAAIGELFGSDPNLADYKIISAGSTTVILIMSTLLFAFVTNARLDQTPVNDQMVVLTSLFLFIFGFIACFSCIYLSEK